MKPLSTFNMFINNLVRQLWRCRGSKRLNFIIRQLCRCVRAIPSRYGPVLRVRRHDFTNHAAIFGTYGDQIPNWIGRLQPNDVFLDIGANTGVFSLIANGLVTRGHIFSFEPNPILYEDLRFNIRLNGARHIIPFNCALSDTTTTHVLAHNATHSGSAALKTPCESEQETLLSNEHIVLAIAPNQLKAVRQWSRNRRVCIKVDVEGHELNVLRGLREAGLLDQAAWAIVEIDAAYLAQFGGSIEELYHFMDEAGLHPTQGIYTSNHYDELFERTVIP
jgi:FkbM family methyltransferase